MKPQSTQICCGIKILNHICKVNGLLLQRLRVGVTVTCFQLAVRSDPAQADSGL